MSSNQQTPLFVQLLQFLFRLWVGFTSVIGTLAILGSVGIVLLIASLASSKGAGQTNFSTHTIKQGGADKVAIIDMTGPIVHQSESSGFSSSTMIESKRILAILQEIQDDETIQSVVLRINSPGGAVVPSDEIYLKLRELQQTKTVITHIEDMAASGGYYIAVGTEKIYANPASITGSIGVIAQLPNASELLQKIGVEFRTIQSGNLKDMGSFARDFTPEEVAVFQSVVDEAYEQFVQAVADGRKMDTETVKKLADGRIYTGKQALDLQLIDGLGTFENTLKIASEGLIDPTIVEYQDKGFFETVFGSKLKPFSLGVENIIPTHKFGVYYLFESGI